MAKMTDDDLARTVTGGAKKFFGTILKAAAITVGTMVLGGIAGGILASSAALGGLATAGCVLVGVVAGGFTGGAVAQVYVLSKAKAAVDAVGAFVDDVNNEMIKQGAKPIIQPAAPVATKELGTDFAAATTAEKPAEAAPAAAAPAPAKQPAQTL